MNFQCFTNDFGALGNKILRTTKHRCTIRTLRVIIVVRSAKMKSCITFLTGRVERQAWYHFNAEDHTFQTVPSFPFNSSYQKSYEPF